MQKVYKITVPISEYSRHTKTMTWIFPKVLRGYKSNGYYERKSLDEKGKIIEDLKIHRIKSKDGKKTISFLIHELVPYQKYPVSFMTQILNIWKCKGLSRTESINMICEIFYDKISDTKETILYDLTNVQLNKFEEIFKKALVSYILWQNKKGSIILQRGTYTLSKFIKLCARNDYSYACILTERYCKDNGQQRFLFGTPSQERYKYKPRYKWH